MYMTDPAVSFSLGAGNLWASQVPLYQSRRMVAHTFTMPTEISSSVGLNSYICMQIDELRGNPRGSWYSS